MPERISLLTLRTFSDTGGIQKMTRTLANSLFRISKNEDWNLKVASLYDANTDLMPIYLPAENFKGYSGSTVRFIFDCIFIQKPTVIILSHVNLAIAGLLTKLFNPHIRLWIIAHGIEVWKPLGLLKKLLLNYAEKVICVSRFTQDQVKARHPVTANKCTILNNTIDPFMQLPQTMIKPAALLKRYGLNDSSPVIFTLTRLNSAERYKGYDKVIKALSGLITTYPNLKYILAGPYDAREEAAVKQLIFDLGLQNHVILTGFIPENELTDHFLLADAFVLPSKGEGFGIVFIEALACGLPVICGNRDGSLDAIKNGELGTGIDPDNIKALESAIEVILAKPYTADKRKQLQKKTMGYFNADTYENDLQKILIAKPAG